MAPAVAAEFRVVFSSVFFLTALRLLSAAAHDESKTG
jgi:hypothetical protein